MAEYILRPGPFTPIRKLVLNADYIRYDNGLNDSTTHLAKADIVDFRHGMDWIRWYRFVVGRRFSVAFKDRNDRELRIVFSSYFGINRHYDQLYADIVNDVWSLYHQEKVDRYLWMIADGQQVILKGITLEREGIVFPKTSLVPWPRIGMSEYYNYFALFDRDDPQVHWRISYNEYET